MRRRMHLWIFVLSATVVLCVAIQFFVPAPTALEKKQIVEGKTLESVALSRFGAYVRPMNWPPNVITLKDSEFVCAPAWKEVVRAGKAESIVIEGTVYCRTMVSEGAAGSVYNEYTYVFRTEERVRSFMFMVRMPQCANYDSPNKEECERQQKEFNPDGVAGEVLDTLK